MAGVINPQKKKRGKVGEIEHYVRIKKEYVIDQNEKDGVIAHVMIKN